MNGVDDDGVIFTTRYCGCCSEVGHKTDSDIQAISVGPGCDEVGTIAHEIGHALGFYHEMSRPDRDTAVRILWENIHPDNRKNFKIEPDIESFGLPYDPYSIMHYGVYDFTWNNLPVMEFLPELMIDKDEFLKRCSGVCGWAPENDCLFEPFSRLGIRGLGVTHGVSRGRSPLG